MSLVHRLKELSLNSTILIVDDNPKLRVHLEEFLERFFLNVLSAENAKVGLSLYNENKPDVLITDIEMPKVNGLEMVKKIRSRDLDIAIIVMSAYDEKEYLLESIKYGVVNYLKKPAKINILCEALIDILQKMKTQNNKKLLDKYTRDLFKEQSSLILLYEKSAPVVANPAFLDFFNVSNLKEFREKYTDLGERFLKQDEFLYNADEEWFSRVSKQPGSHFHVKISDQNYEHHHFLLKYISMSDEKGYGLLTLDDITELDLVALFNMDEADGDGMFFGDSQSIEKSIKLLIEKGEGLHVYNFYKGLSITNKAEIASCQEGVLTIKVNENQLIASKYENALIIGSKILPNFIWCDKIISYNDKLNYITVTDLKFMRSNPTKRKVIRLEPAEDHKVSLYFKLKEFLGEISIVDISIEGMKLKMNSLLVGMKDGESVELSIVLARKNDNLSLSMQAKILRIDRYDGFFYVVVSFDLESDKKHSLISYISKRQMELIREFKALSVEPFNG